MENSKKYLKLYQQKAQFSFDKWGYYYPPRNWEEFYAWENQSYEKYLHDETDPVKKTESYLSLLDHTKEFGFYVAFTQQDYTLLNDVLYQTSRQELLYSAMLASGTDHAVCLLDLANAFACNDFAVIDSFLPSDLPHSVGRYYTEVSANLLRILYYKEEENKGDALRKAEKFLSKKITLWEKFVVLYFMALIKKDAKSASNCLQALCLAYQRIGYPKDKLDKCFASEIHGFYRFARKIDPELFEQITMPAHPCFLQTFEIWQKQHQYPEGKLFYERPPKLAYINDILKAPIPKAKLEPLYLSKREYLKNVGQFAIDLTENVEKWCKNHI